MASTTPTLQLLQASVDETGQDSYLRLLYKGRFVKYIVIATGVYDTDDMIFGPTITALLEPILPEGTWNHGYVDKDATTGLPRFTESEQKQFPGVVPVWHPTMVDHLELKLGYLKLKPGVYDATCSRFDVPLVTKFAVWDCEIPDINNEFATHQSIEGHNIGPKFLGNVVEEGRVIGFFMERLTDELGDARHATAGDLDICSQTLTKLHNLGILHGDINKHNILITTEGATLIDFANSKKSDDKLAFEAEMQSLEGHLCDDSDVGRPGGRFIRDLNLEDYLPADEIDVKKLKAKLKASRTEHEGDIPT